MPLSLLPFAVFLAASGQVSTGHSGQRLAQGQLLLKNSFLVSSWIKEVVGKVGS